MRAAGLNNSQSFQGKTATKPVPATPAAAKTRRFPVGFWKRQVRTWHWMSGAVCLIGMLLFALTGITLNHAADIPATPTTVERTMTLDESGLEALSAINEDVTDAPVPAAVRRAIRSDIGVRLGNATAEWTEVDVYVALPKPGADGWLSIDRATGEVFYEKVSRGTVSYLNDLHKGRNTGLAWSWFLDIFAVACMVFCLSGLWLLQIHSTRRRSTWPLAIGGLAAPALLLIIFVHL